VADQLAEFSKFRDGEPPEHFVELVRRVPELFELSDESEVDDYALPLLPALGIGYSQRDRDPAPESLHSLQFRLCEVVTEELSKTSSSRRPAL
jgi:hypothetical protein